MKIIPAEVAAIACCNFNSAPCSYRSEADLDASAVWENLNSRGFDTQQADYGAHYIQKLAERYKISDKVMRSVAGAQPKNESESMVTGLVSVRTSCR